MKYLYVLTSTQKDSFYEQFFLSLTSLRLVMPNANVVLLCDSKTKETLIGKRSEYEKLISDIIIINIPIPLSQVEISRWLKTSMRHIIKGDFLYIDCDTIIAEDLSSIFKSDITIGACLDCHSPISSHSNRNTFISCDKKLKFTSYLSDKQFNGGVIFCSDTPETHKIINKWHELWIYSSNKKIIRDQPSFNMAIYENSTHFTELDGTWNCQLVANYLPYLFNAKIIHYFATNITLYSSPFLLASDYIFNSIKESGTISDSILELLKSPKTAFVPHTRVLSGKNMLEVLESDLFKSLYFINKKAPLIFKMNNNIVSFFKKIIKYFLIKKSKKKNEVQKYYY